MKYLHTFNENVTEDQKQFFFDKHKLNDARIEVFNAFSAQSQQDFIDNATKTSSGWVTNIIHRILDLTRYPGYKIYLKEQWPGGQGSKNAIDRLILPLLYTGELKIEKLTALLNSGRKTNREFLSVDLVDAQAQQQLATKQPPISSNLYAEENGICVVKQVGHESVLKSIKENEQNLLRLYLEKNPNNYYKNELLEYSFQYGNLEAARLIIAEPDFIFTDIVTVFYKIGNSNYRYRSSADVETKILQLLKNMKFNLTFQQIKDIQEKISETVNEVNTRALEALKQLANIAVDKLDTTESNVEIDALEIVTLLKKQHYFILYVYINMGIIDEDELETYKVVANSFI